MSALKLNRPAAACIIFLLIPTLLLLGCQHQLKVNSISLSADDQAEQLFETIFMQEANRSPIFLTRLGIRQDWDKWDDYSETFIQESHELDKQNLARLQQLDNSQLNPRNQLSLKLYIQQFEDRIEDFEWRDHSYIFSQMRGLHSYAPAVLINQHRIVSIYDAENYISRLEALPLLIDQLIDQMNSRAEKGVLAPKFVYPYVITVARNIISGAPFDNGAESALYRDFKKKVQALAISDADSQLLIQRAELALLIAVKPSYEKLIAAVLSVEELADTRDGVWKLPDGENFYKNRLKRITTTSMSAEEIHTTGLSEVARIHQEMRLIMQKIGFKGELKEFFKHMRTAPEFYYPDTDEGRARYLSEATAVIDAMKLRLDELFGIKPKARLVVKAVETFREKSSGKAFYSLPSMDGTRPGTYYANLHKMSSMPTYQMKAPAYHEGIPGHHMQMAIAQELEGIPTFRKYARYTAYTEGWGLYAEYIPKELGLYDDPYADFGRLAMELWRACRLVVDTGIHAKKWTRQQGIDYYVTHTPNPVAEAVKMVERHIVMPGQATAYKIGMMKIIELREKASKALGDSFDIREFHDLVLGQGPLPLNVLEEQLAHP